MSYLDVLERIQKLEQMSADAEEEIAYLKQEHGIEDVKKEIENLGKNSVSDVIKLLKEAMAYDEHGLRMGVNKALEILEFLKRRNNERSSSSSRS